MMDLGQEFGAQAERLADIEVMIAQNAKSRYDIRVTAVYWRMNEGVPMGRPVPGIRGALPADAHHAQAAPARAESVIAAPKAGAARYEPIDDDEVAAFRQALAAASAQGPVTAGNGATPARRLPHSYALLTGFEDTEMPGAAAAVPALSATQYGDLI
jgi:hypothetical protein